MNSSKEDISTLLRAVAPFDNADPLRSLLARVALRDRNSFEQLYRATATYLFSIALRVLRDEGRADEILQDAYISIWQKAGSYQAEVATPMTWMINIVRNRAIDALRAGRNERSLSVQISEEALEVADGGMSDPLALFDESMRRCRIDQCMYALPPLQRQALAMAYYRGMVHAEIAESLGSPLGTVKSWIRRGLEQLRACMDNVGERT